MARNPPSLRLILLAALFASPSSAQPASGIFARKDSCPVDSNACPSELPSNFCCRAGTKCSALAGNTTVVCCPEGSTCSKIRPITCDIRAQDVSKHADASFKTTVFNVPLEKCGNQCCPFGYTCQDEQCVLNKDQSAPPKGAVVSSISTNVPKATSTSEPEASSTGSAATTAGPDSTASSAPATSGSKPHTTSAATTSIIGGVVAGCVILLAIAVVLFICVRRRNQRTGVEPSTEKKGGNGLYHHQNHQGSTTSTNSFGNLTAPDTAPVISGPISLPGSYRSDFIRKTPSVSSRTTTTLRNSPKSSSKPPVIHISSYQHDRISIPNPFDSPDLNLSPSHLSAEPSPIEEQQPVRRGRVTARLAPIRSMRASFRSSRYPATPTLQRDPSSESINVFADPDTVVGRSKPRPLTGATTFTDLMDQADLSEVRRGGPYVPGTTPRI